MSNLRKLKKNLHKQCPKCGKYSRYKTYDQSIARYVTSKIIYKHKK